MLKDNQITAGDVDRTGTQRLHPEEGVITVVLLGAQPIVLLSLDQVLLHTEVDLVADIEQPNFVIKLNLSSFEAVSSFDLPQPQLLSRQLILGSLK